MTREVCFLIGRGGAVLWGDVSASPASLADSRARWEAIWEWRAELEEIAHSHPHGPLGFSREDETTMRALVAGLGTQVRFSVVAPDGMLRRAGTTEEQVAPEPWWAELLRLASGMPPATASNGADG
ncbi:MAG TPA: hypothetical protein VE618_03500 [Myxococcaceae bacterium]|nr:hypothetical protein [Myxococcaceae bacterium]